MTDDILYVSVRGRAYTPPEIRRYVMRELRLRCCFLPGLRHVDDRSVAADLILHSPLYEDARRMCNGQTPTSAASFLVGHYLVTRRSP